MQLCGFSCTQRSLQKKGFYIRIVDILELLVFQTLIMQDHPLIGDLPEAFACFLEKILCHEKTRSRVWYRNLVRCQTIVQW